MHKLDLILTLTGGLAAALVCGYLTQRLKLSPIVGYLLAGIVVGPHTPGFVANQELAEQFAEIGVILLLFGVGLDFHLEHLLKVRKLVVPGGVMQITWTATLTTLLTQALGWELHAGVVFGLSLSVASPVVMVRVLADNRALHTPTGHSALGWLVVEDLVVVLLLVLLPALVGEAGGEAQQSLLLVLGGALVKITAAVGAIFLIGGRVLPWLIEQAAFKAYPCCHYLQAAIECLAGILARGLRAESISRVICELPEEVAWLVCEPWTEKLRPPSGHVAKFSLPYCLAAVMVDGDVDVDTFDRQSVDPRLVAMGERVQFAPMKHSGFPQRYAAGIRVETFQGGVYEEQVLDVQGSASRPFSSADVETKFRRNAGRLLMPEAVDAVVDAVVHLDTALSLDVLTSALRRHSPSRSDGTMR